MKEKERLSIWRDANQLLLEIEQAVRRFPRYHKYAVGAATGIPKTRPASPRC